MTKIVVCGTHYIWCVETQDMRCLGRPDICCLERPVEKEGPAVHGPVEQYGGVVCRASARRSSKEVTVAESTAGESKDPRGPLNITITLVQL